MRYLCLTIVSLISMIASTFVTQIAVDAKSLAVAIFVLAIVCFHQTWSSYELELGVKVTFFRLIRQWHTKLMISLVFKERVYGVWGMRVWGMRVWFLDNH